MNAIVAVDKNWGIGKDGRLLFDIPEDKRFVKSTTMGKVLVIGRSTFETLPGGKPLKGRTNIALSSDQDFSPDGVIVCRSMDELRNELKKYQTDDVFVFGGQKVYEQLLPHCKYAYVTKVEAEAPADRFFPNLETLEGWKLKDTILWGMYLGLEYEIMLFENERANSL